MDMLLQGDKNGVFSDVCGYFDKEDSCDRRGENCMSEPNSFDVGMFWRICASDSPFLKTEG